MFTYVCTRFFIAPRFTDGCDLSFETACNSVLNHHNITSIGYPCKKDIILLNCINPVFILMKYDYTLYQSSE
jgi:hypothetical protein